MRQRYTTGHGKTYLSESGRGVAYRALLFLLLALYVLLVSGSTPGSSLAQQDENHAGLVIQFGDGTTNTYCIPFTGETITGLDLLTRTGLDITAETQGMLGGMVCRIGPDGCNYPQEACVCQSYGPDGKYWVYSHLRDGAWKFSSTGPSSYKVRDGEVDGWAWSSGKGPSITPSFAEVCAEVLPAQPKPTDTPQPKPPEPTSTTPPPLPPKNTPIPPPTKPPVIVSPTNTPLPPAPTVAPTVAQKPEATPTRTPTPFTEQATQVVVPNTPLSATDTPTPLPTETSTPAPTGTRPTTPEPTSTSNTLSKITNTPTASATPTAIAWVDRPTRQAFVETFALCVGLGLVSGLVLWWFGIRERRP